jgi:hypothetical protein
LIGPNLFLDHYYLQNYLKKRIKLYVNLSPAFTACLSNLLAQELNAHSICCTYALSQSQWLSPQLTQWWRKFWAHTLVGLWCCVAPVGGEAASGLSA